MLYNGTSYIIAYSTKSFERENNTTLDAEKQVEREDKEKEWELER